MMEQPHQNISPVPRASHWYGAYRFWGVTLITLLPVAIFFAWELGYLDTLGLSGPPRPSPTLREVILSVLIAILFALNCGLYAWQKKFGTCPIGIKRATGIAGAVGALSLICPACTFGIIGFGALTISLVALSPFIPLMQIIAIILLSTSLWMLIPRS